MDVYDQAEYDIRFEWGERGVDVMAPLSDIVVIVDVLSFSTCVDVAVARGVTVYPFGWKDERAEAYADRMNARLATGRGQGPLSLSPPSLATLNAGDRVVLPSPNGSTLTVAAARHATTIAGCLRNRTAVADYVNGQDGSVTVIACGERWHDLDHSLRPALEDQLGAGAIVDALSGSRSPEAEAAAAVFVSVDDTLDTLRRCSSGKELIAKGYPDDVAYASEVDVSRSVPLLTDGAYTAASG